MKNVLLVFGGKSYEHDISVVTASQIYSKTKLKETKLVPFYISRDDRCFIYESDKFDLKDFSKNGFSEKNKKFKEVVFVWGEKNKIFVKTHFGLKEYLESDVAIFACHGSSGENGKLVSIFESIGICTSAGNFDSLAVCMNKFLFKQVMKGIKVPVVSGFKISEKIYENNKESFEKKFNKMKYPVILKANNGGSSIGVFVAESKEDFTQKLNDAFEFDNEVLIEKFIDGSREFNVAVIGTSDSYEVSEVDEPLKKHELLSFTDKYLSNGGKNCKVDKSLKNSMATQSRKFPAEISSNLSGRIKGFASKIFESLNLCGVVRIDFLYDEATDKLYVCEVNSIPGSLSYYFFKENKILVNDLVNRLIQIAYRNSENKNLINEEFSTDILSES